MGREMHCALNKVFRVIIRKLWSIIMKIVATIAGVIIFFNSGDSGIKEEPHIHQEPYLVQNCKVLSSIPGSAGELTSDSNPDFILYTNNR